MRRPAAVMCSVAAQDEVVVLRPVEADAEPADVGDDRSAQHREVARVHRRPEPLGDQSGFRKWAGLDDRRPACAPRRCTRSRCRRRRGRRVPPSPSPARSARSRRRGRGARRTRRWPCARASLVAATMPPFTERWCTSMRGSMRRPGPARPAPRVAVEQSSTRHHCQSVKVWDCIERHAGQERPEGRVVHRGDDGDAGEMPGNLPETSGRLPVHMPGHTAAVPPRPPRPLRPPPSNGWTATAPGTRRRGWYRTPVTTATPTGPCRVYVSEHGNVFMREIADHLVEALVDRRRSGRGDHRSSARPARPRRRSAAPVRGGTAPSSSCCSGGEADGWRAATPLGLHQHRTAGHAVLRPRDAVRPPWSGRRSTSTPIRCGDPPPRPGGGAPAARLRGVDGPVDGRHAISQRSIDLGFLGGRTPRASSSSAVRPVSCGSGGPICASSAGTVLRSPAAPRSPAATTSTSDSPTPASCSTCTATASPTSSGPAWSRPWPTAV